MRNSCEMFQSAVSPSVHTTSALTCCGINGTLPLTSTCHQQSALSNVCIFSLTNNMQSVWRPTPSDTPDVVTDAGVRRRTSRLHAPFDARPLGSL